MTATPTPEVGNRLIAKCDRSEDGCTICRLSQWCHDATREQLEDRVFELSELCSWAEHGERENMRRADAYRRLVQARLKSIREASL